MILSISLSWEKKNQGTAWKEALVEIPPPPSPFLLHPPSVWQQTEDMLVHAHILEALSPHQDDCVGLSAKSAIAAQRLPGLGLYEDELKSRSGGESHPPPPLSFLFSHLYII